MLSINKIQLAFCAFFFTAFTVNGQTQRPVRQCSSGTHTHTPVTQFRTTPYLSQAKIKKTNRTTLLNLPVVVHIVHRSNESIDTGNNLSYDQIMSQINATNKDLKLENPNKEQTLQEFQNSISKLNIELKMAIYDPNGNELEEPGVNRIVGSGGYSSIQANRLISENIWNPEKYLNIWVIPLSSGDLGYAFFPNYLEFADGIVGSGEIASNTIDGVVIDPNFFGSNEFKTYDNLRAPYDLGRTLTHELGHYFGLLHIWGTGGNSSCAVDDQGEYLNHDFCDDTPHISSNHASGSITVCDGTNSNVTTYLCETEKFNSAQYQNFMDYTDDACMTMFSLDQKARVDIVMDSAPQRATLNADSPTGTINLNATQGKDFHALTWTLEDVDNAKAIIVEKQIDNEGYQIISPALSLTTDSYNYYYDPSEVSKKISYRVYLINNNAYSYPSNQIYIQDGVVGIRPPAVDSSFTIFPNPSEGIFTFNPSEYMHQQGVVEVLSIYGKKILTKYIYDKNNTVSIDLSSQPRGTYIMLLRSDKGTYTQRCIKR
ncbi:M43 family zinc metalloprotease [Flammeovirga aprica]|uniref:T9SS type A sorting domain-containing protein n=1 Tax=Flammeovirga aprica JL-4 TaxID=694437 RepID=A0A7X9RVN6_9BACT|nr:M43 family zinc metalloprotease [Flammeovirga aprica]NME69489.1 T9SS type A sorting domain-containing protein [Flammeovirga aprica JL-4]